MAPSHEAFGATSEAETDAEHEALRDLYVQQAALLDTLGREKEAAAALRAALDADPDFRPSRRWGPLLIVLLVFGGAVAVGVLAFQRHLQQKESDDRPLPAPI